MWSLILFFIAVQAPWLDHRPVACQRLPWRRLRTFAWHCVSSYISASHQSLWPCLPAFPSLAQRLGPHIAIRFDYMFVIFFFNFHEQCPMQFSCVFRCHVLSSGAWGHVFRSICLMQFWVSTLLRLGDPLVRSTFFVQVNCFVCLSFARYSFFCACRCFGQIATRNKLFTDIVNCKNTNDNKD